MRATFAALMCFFALNLNAQSLSPKHDIGLRLGSFDKEQFQLEYRYHLNEKWSFSARAYFGAFQSIRTEGEYLIPDSLYESFTYEFQRLSYGLSFGAQRQLNFMKHDFYYVGANIGAGVVRYENIDQRMIYEPYFDQSISFNIYGPPPVGTVIERELTGMVSNALNFTNHIYVGADVPIVNRLSLNLEIGILSDLELSSTGFATFSTLTMAPFASGGIRYSFGANDE